MMGVAMCGGECCENRLGIALRIRMILHTGFVFPLLLSLAVARLLGGATSTERLAAVATLGSNPFLCDGAFC